MLKKVYFAGILLVGLLVPCSRAQTEKGAVCVASRRDDPWWKVPPPDSIDTRGYKVRIDNRPVVAWPAKQSLKLDDLDLQERHLLVIIDGSGKAVESVRFHFSDYKSADLCMTYDGYQGMQLKEESRHTPWCKCNRSK
jgi:hypothetical protein